MKFSWVRFISLFFVLCFCLSLMCCFVFASSSDDFVLTFTYNYDVGMYFANSDSSVVNLAIECFNNNWPVKIVVDGLGIFDFNPSDYHNNGNYLYLTPLSAERIQFGIDVLNYDLIVNISPYIKEQFHLPDTVVGSFSYVKPPHTSLDLLSDLQLTGNSFLETVQGIILTIGSNPLLLLTVGIFFAGGCIAIFSRLLSKN